MKLFSLAVAVLALVALPAIAADEPAKPEVGKPAPAIELTASSINTVFPDKKDAKTLSLADFKGKKNVVLYFYPKAMTPGCTKESCAFRDNLKEFADYDTVVIGISCDKLEDQVKFTEKEKLTFPLFADTDKKVTKAYGVLRDSGTPMRSTFIINKEGNVVKIYNPVTGDAGKHPAEVLEFVKKELKK